MNTQTKVDVFSVPPRAAVNVVSIKMHLVVPDAPEPPVYYLPTNMTQKLINEAEKLWGIPQGSIKSATRLRHITQPRFAVIYAARRMTRPQRSYPEIGRVIGGRDHSTIISGERRAVELRKTDPEFASLLACLMMNVWRARRVKLT